MVTGSSELMIQRATRWVPRNVKKVKSSSNHRASLLCLKSARKKELISRLLNQSTSTSIQSTVLFSITLLSQSTISSTVKFQHIRVVTRKMQVSSLTTMLGLSVQKLMQVVVIRHLSTTQRLLLLSMRKFQTSIKQSLMYTVR